MQRRMAIAPQKVCQMENLYKNTDKNTKSKFLKACVFLIDRCGCESNIIGKTTEHKKKANAFDSTIIAQI